MNLKKVGIIFIMCFFVFNFSNASESVEKVLAPATEQTKESETKKRRKKVMMCQECGKPESHCDCEGHGDHNSDDNHGDH